MRIERCRKALTAAFVVAALPLLAGCVTVAEFRKLERDVRDMQRGSPGGATADGRERLADVASQMEGLQREVERLQGRIEVNEHRIEDAVEEAKAARREAAATSSVPANVEPGPVPRPSGGGEASRDKTASAEVGAYRAAYAAWRSGDADACVDRFRNFLQTYPDSGYADDASYWMADCYFKSGDYKTAILRFDDVVARYPSGERAADALYRQGEALLRLGPGYGKAAGKAFERVLREYPNSPRSPEAQRQLNLLGAG